MKSCQFGIQQPEKISNKLVRYAYGLLGIWPCLYILFELYITSKYINLFDSYLFDKAAIL